MTNKPTVEPLSMSHAVGLLLPVSYGTKHLWNLEVPFVEPAFVLVLWLWWTRRDVARLTVLEWALVLSFVVSTVGALRHDILTTPRWLDAWSHTGRTFALLATIAWARTLDYAQKDALFSGVMRGLSAVLVLSVVVALIGLGLLPNLLLIDTEYADYESRFVLRLGPVALPRLAGLCWEPAPFGAMGVAALVLSQCMQQDAFAQATATGRRAWTVIVTSLSDQAFLGALWLLIAKRRRGRSPLSGFAVFVVAAVAVPYLAERLSERAMEFLDLADDPLVFEQLWGSSGGERILNSILALGLLTDSTLNFLIGVGPTLFGVFASDLIPVIGEQHQVQVLLPDLLCSVGVVGTGFVVANAIAWWRRAGSTVALSSLLALLLANLFQSDFKSPALGIAIGCSLASLGGAKLSKGDAA